MLGAVKPLGKMQHSGPHYGTAAVPGVAGAWVPTGATTPDWGAPQPLPPYTTPMKEMEGKVNYNQ